MKEENIMEKEKKMTKKDYFMRLNEIVNGTDIEDKGELIYFIESQIASIDNKAEKAKERAAAKKAEGDELREIVKSKLTGEFQTADDIFAQIDAGEDISIAKVRARLTQLVNLGEAEKSDVKTDDGKAKKAYKIA
jgi:plasmid stability protein